MIIRQNITILGNNDARAFALNRLRTRAVPVLAVAGPLFRRNQVPPGPFVLAVAGFFRHFDHDHGRRNFVRNLDERLVELARQCQRGRIQGHDGPAAGHQGAADSQ